MNFTKEQIEQMHLYDFKKETDHWTDIGLEFQDETGLLILPPESHGEDPCDGFLTYDEWGKKPLRFYFFEELSNDQKKKLKEIVKE